MTTAIQTQKHSFGRTSWSQLFAAVAAFLVTSVLVLANASPAQAGCGCSKPIPDRGHVWPPALHPEFDAQYLMASGEAVSSNFKFQDLTSYTINIGGRRVESTGTGRAITWTMLSVSSLGLSQGYKSVTLAGPGISGTKNLGSVFIHPRPIYLSSSSMSNDIAYERDVEVYSPNSKTIYFLLDLEDFRDAAVFTIDFPYLPFKFRGDSNSVEFYDPWFARLNKPGLSKDANDWWTEGLQVDGGSSLPYHTPVMIASKNPGFSSDILVYARHEFHDWARKHEPGGSMYVGDAFGIFHGPEVSDQLGKYEKFMLNQIGPSVGEGHVDHDHVMMVWNGNDLNTASIPPTLTVRVVATKYSGSTPPSPSQAAQTTLQLQQSSSSSSGSTHSGTTSNTTSSTSTSTSSSSTSMKCTAGNPQGLSSYQCGFDQCDPRRGDGGDPWTDKANFNDWCSGAADRGCTKPCASWGYTATSTTSTSTSTSSGTTSSTSTSSSSTSVKCTAGNPQGLSSYQCGFDQCDPRRGDGGDPWTDKANFNDWCSGAADRGCTKPCLSWGYKQ